MLGGRTKGPPANPGFPVETGCATMEPARPRPESGQPRDQAAACLCARRSRNAQPKPDRNRPRPPPASADRRLGTAQTVVALLGFDPSEIRPRRPRTSRPCSRKLQSSSAVPTASVQSSTLAAATALLNGTTPPPSPTDTAGTRRYVLRPERVGLVERLARSGRLRLKRTEGEDDPPTMRWDDGPDVAVLARYPLRARGQTLVVARLAPPPRAQARPDGSGRAARDRPRPRRSSASAAPRGSTTPA